MSHSTAARCQWVTPLLVMAVCAAPSANAQDASIQRIRAHYQATERDLRNMVVRRIPPEVIFGPSSDADPSWPDTASAYFQGKSLKKLVLSIPGEDWDYTEHLYYEDGQLYFAHVTGGRFAFGRPQPIEQRAYFEGGRLIRYVGEDHRDQKDYAPHAISINPTWADSIASVIESEAMVSLPVRAEEVVPHPALGPAARSPSQTRSYRPVDAELEWPGRATDAKSAADNQGTKPVGGFVNVLMWLGITVLLGALMLVSVRQVRRLPPVPDRVRRLPLQTDGPLITSRSVVAPVRGGSAWTTLVLLCTALAALGVFLPWLTVVGSRGEVTKLGVSYASGWLTLACIGLAMATKKHPAFASNRWLWYMAAALGPAYKLYDFNRAENMLVAGNFDVGMSIGIGLFISLVAAGASALLTRTSAPQSTGDSTSARQAVAPRADTDNQQVALPRMLAQGLTALPTALSTPSHAVAMRRLCWALAAISALALSYVQYQRTQFGSSLDHRTASAVDQQILDVQTAVQEGRMGIEDGNRAELRLRMNNPVIRDALHEQCNNSAEWQAICAQQRASGNPYLP